MSSILYNIIISPIELVVEIVFELMFRIVGRHETNQGLAVIGVSLAISLLTLPLYRRADAVQQKERDIQAKLSHWVKHIRKTFKGDERFMMLQTYYRQNNYNPLYALNGSISLLLEIPFFIAAYHFLSHLEALNGASFGLILDLGKPDSLIKFGDVSLNLLPILMTAINCISSAVYLKGFPLKDKIQTYGMALIFLVLLYNSPSGLVVYWTCNNIFSLGKNIFYKIRNPKKYIVILCALFGVLLTFALILSGVLNSRKKLFVVFLFQYVAILPLFFYLARNTVSKMVSISIRKNSIHSQSILMGCMPCLGLFVLIGLVIPSNLISASPVEFSLSGRISPLFFLSQSISRAFGMFLFWPLCVRLLFSGNKCLSFLIDRFLLFAFFTALVNSFVFPIKAGLISTWLEYANPDGFSFESIGLLKLSLNSLCLILIFILTIASSFLKKQRFFFIVCMVFSLSLLGLGIHNCYSINFMYKNYIASVEKSDKITNNFSRGKISPVFHLSKTGKNVFIIGIDRADGFYVPYIMEEHPELKEIFSGFTYYPNTVTFNRCTLAGSLPLYGGYEYVPAKINLRREPLLISREEAISMLPRLFAQNDYSCTMTDMPWIGETGKSDFYFMDKLPEKINTIRTYGRYVNQWMESNSVSIANDIISKNSRNILANALVVSMPYILREIFYCGGTYLNSNRKLSAADVISNESSDMMATIADYSVLDFLPILTDTSEENNTFTFMYNNLTHHPAYLQAPNYVPVESVTNIGTGPFCEENHYHVNAASLLRIAEWLQWLKKNGVYDNTRIIISADHGGGHVGAKEYLPQHELNPLLLVKDFNAHGNIKKDDTFMTNGDVPTIAVGNLIDNPLNPVSGKNIMNEISKKKCYIDMADWQKVKDIDGDCFLNIDENEWCSVHDNIFDKNNWSWCSEKEVYHELGVPVPER